ncbi:MAG: hypothetical protein Q9205_008023 [Flavoplaca limonia]
MTPFILLLSLLSLVAAAPIITTTTTSSPSSAAPTGVYTYTNTAITVSGTSIVLPSGTSTTASATSIVVPTAFVFPPVVFAAVPSLVPAALDVPVKVEMQLAPSATCAECGHMSVALPLPSPSVGLSAESAHVSVIPGLHSDVAAGDVHVGDSGGQDGNYGVGVPGHSYENVSAEDSCVGAPHCEHGHHSSSSSSPAAVPSATPTSAENTHLGAPYPILPRQDEPGSVDGNYGVGVPSHHSSAAVPSATSAENGHIGAPSHHGDDHGIGAEHGCVGCPNGEHAGGHGQV